MGQAPGVVVGGEVADQGRDAVAPAQPREHLLQEGSLAGPGARHQADGEAKRGDRHVYAARSRFIPGGLLDRFELSAWPAAPQAAFAAPS